MALDGIQTPELRHLLADRHPHDLPRRRWFVISQGLLDRSHGHMGSSARFPYLPNPSLHNNIERNYMRFKWAWLRIREMESCLDFLKLITYISRSYVSALWRTNADVLGNLSSFLEVGLSFGWPRTPLRS
jgi:hypothetical protein